MELDLNARRDQDLGRGTALLVSGAVMVLLKWILPPVAPVAIAAYALYRLYYKDVAEGLLALALAALAWVLRYPLGWLLWLAGLGMVGFGLFFVIRGLRADAPPSE